MANEWPRKAVVLSHELVRGSPFDVERREPNDFVSIYPADQFYDGNMWHLTEHGSDKFTNAEYRPICSTSGAPIGEGKRL